MPLKSCHQGIHNARLRRLVDRYIKGCQPGKKVDVYDMMRTLGDGRRHLTAHRVSLFLRERTDLRHTGMNEWEVVR